MVSGRFKWKVAPDFTKMMFLKMSTYFVQVVKTTHSPTIQSWCTCQSSLQIISFTPLTVLILVTSSFGNSSSAIYVMNNNSPCVLCSFGMNNSSSAQLFKLSHIYVPICSSQPRCCHREEARRADGRN